MIGLGSDKKTQEQIFYQPHQSGCTPVQPLKEFFCHKKWTENTFTISFGKLKYTNWPTWLIWIQSEFPHHCLPLPVFPPPSPEWKVRKFHPGKFHPKRLRLCIRYWTKKAILFFLSPKMDQKNKKIYEERQKLSFWIKKAWYFVKKISRNWGYPPSPLTLAGLAPKYHKKIMQKKIRKGFGGGWGLGGGIGGWVVGGGGWVRNIVFDSFPLE